MSCWFFSEKLFFHPAEPEDFEHLSNKVWMPQSARQMPQQIQDQLRANVLRVQHALDMLGTTQIKPDTFWDCWAQQMHSLLGPADIFKFINRNRGNAI